jgi:hypothetical protein
MNAYGNNNATKIHGWYIKLVVVLIRSANAFMNSVIGDCSNFFLKEPPKWYPGFTKNNWMSRPPAWFPAAMEYGFLYVVSVAPVLFGWVSIWLLYIGIPTLFTLNFLRRKANKKWPHILTNKLLSGGPRGE